MYWHGSWGVDRYVWLLYFCFFALGLATKYGNGRRAVNIRSVLIYIRGVGAARGLVIMVFY